MHTTLISDTHFQHKKLQLEGGDMLIHAGDLCGHGTEAEAVASLEGLKSNRLGTKILLLETTTGFFKEYGKTYLKTIMPINIHYLQDSGVKIEETKNWGSPVKPNLLYWAFNRKRGKEINKYRKLIIADTDIKSFTDRHLEF